MRKRTRRNRRNMVLPLILLVLAMISASCGGGEPGDDQEYKMSSNDYLNSIITDAAAVSIADVVEGQYEPPLSLELSGDDIDSLKSFLGSVELGEEPSYSRGFYKIVISDAAGKTIDDWLVDSSGSIVTREGTFKCTANDEVAAWFNEIETDYDITYDSIYGRKPGSNYFTDLSGASEGVLTEITENNLIEGIEYELTQDEISSLAECAGNNGNIQISSEKQDEIDLECRISVFDNNGAELHIIDVSKDGRLFCNGYEISSDQIRNWADGVRKNSGLSERE